MQMHRTISKMRSLLSSSLPLSRSLSRPSSLPSPLLLPIARPPQPPSRRLPISLHPKPSPLVVRSYACGRGPPMDARLPPSGEIHVIVGPMFAGKTTALLRRIQAERDDGRKVVIIKSDKDNRYGLDSIVTHNGAKMPCWSLPELSMFRMKLGAEAYDKLDVIGIDEAQFFGDLYDFCCRAADHDGKTVIVAGLDGDYLRRSFGSVLDIIPIADSVTKLTARCELCGKHAFFTLRKSEEKQTELIGGADVYMPVCRQHYVMGQVVVETVRLALESRMIQCDSYIEAAPTSI